MDAKTRAIQALAELYSDPAVRQARMDELGDAGLETLGKSILRQDDYSRSMNELGAQRQSLAAKEAEANALYEGNTEWRAQREADLAELDALRADLAAGKLKREGGTPTPTPTPTPAPNQPKYLTAEDLAQTERGAVAFIAESNTLTMEHFQKFGQILDISGLLTDKRVQQLGLRGVYTERFKPQLDELAAKSRAADEEKIRADERQKIAVAQASSHHPYPVRGNEPSTLDNLERASSGQPPAVKSVDEMANEYARLNAQRNSVGVG